MPSAETLDIPTALGPVAPHWGYTPPGAARPKPPARRRRSSASTSRRGAHWLPILRLASLTGELTSAQVAARLNAQPHHASAWLQRIADTGCLEPVRLLTATTPQGGRRYLVYAITPAGRAWLADQTEAAP